MTDTKAAMLRSHKIYTLEAAGFEDITNISTEGISEFFSDARHHLINIFSKSGRFSGSVAATPSVISKVTAMDRGAIGKLEIPCVPGFTGDSLEYLKVLDYLRTTNCDPLLGKILKPFNKLLGYYVNRPDQLGVLSRSEIYSTIKLSNLNDRRENLQRFTSPNKSHSRLPFFSVYKQQVDFATVSKNIDKLMYDFEKNDDDEIVKYINDCGEKLNMLIGYLQGEWGDKHRISKTVSEDLSKVTLSIAEECEFYSMCRQSASVFAKAFKDQVDFFKNLA